jgi:acetate kinase
MNVLVFNCGSSSLKFQVIGAQWPHGLGRALRYSS